MIVDPRTEVVLRSRLRRARRLLSMSSTVFPGMVAISCAAQAGLGGTGAGFTWWTLVPAFAAAVPVAFFAQWARGRGFLDPSAWLPTAFTTVGVQLLLGVIPSYGIAVNTASGAGKAAATAVFALCWVFAGMSCLNAHLARRAMLEPLVPELGSTSVRLTLPARFALTSHAFVSARIDLGLDRIEWTARLHRGRSAGPRVDHSVHFGQIGRVAPVLLPVDPPLLPWLALPDGTVLYVQPGPAVVLSTATGEWLLPVHDAQMVVELINRRKALWTQGSR